MEIPKIQPKIPSVAENVEHLQKQETDAEPVGFPQNDSVIEAAANTFDDVLTGAKNGQEDSGIRDPNNQQHDITEAEKKFQQAIAQGSDDAQGAQGPAGGFTGDRQSIYESRLQGLQDFFAKHGIDFGSGNSGGGGAVSSTGSNSGGRGQAGHIGERLGIGTSGPPSLKDLTDALNKTPLDKLKDLAGALGLDVPDGSSPSDFREMIRSAIQDAIAGPQTGADVASYGTDLFAQQAGGGTGGGVYSDEGIKGGHQTADAFPNLSNFVRKTYVDGGATSPRSEALRQAEEEINSDSGIQAPKDKYSNHDDGSWSRFDANGTTAEIRNKDGSHEYWVKDSKGQWTQANEKDYKKAKETADKKAGVSPGGGTAGTAGDGGTAGTAGTSGKGDVLPPGDSDYQMGHKPGSKSEYWANLLHVPGATIGKDGGDPSPEGSEIIGGEIRNVGAIEGEYGLLGNPGTPGGMGDGGGGTFHLGSFGNSPLVDGTGEVGVQRDENKVADTLNRATLKPAAGTSGASGTSGTSGTSGSAG